MKPTSKERWGKPTDAYRAGLREATEADYRALELAVVGAMVEDIPHIVLTLGYTCKFPPDFPRGLWLKREGFVDEYQVKTGKVLKWLNAHGHSNITGEMIRQCKITLTCRANKIDVDLEE